MVGRLSGDKDNKGGKLIVEGLGTGKGFEQLIDKLNEQAGFKLVKKQGGTGPSDHDSFYRKKIPVFFFWSGTHEQYHKPSDTSDLINVPGMKRIADLAEKVIVQLASDAETARIRGCVRRRRPPTFAKGPRLGIAPDYEEGKEGRQGCRRHQDGVADTAGIKTGDLIVEIGGQAGQEHRDVHDDHGRTEDRPNHRDRRDARRQKGHAQGAAEVVPKPRSQSHDLPRRG